MKRLYIDSDFKCHTTNPDGIYTEVILSDNARKFFTNKCTTFIEGYRYVPMGETWTRSDGAVFHGEMIIPWKPYSELAAAQREHEKQLLKELQENSIPVAELEAAYQEGVNSAYD